MMPISTKCRSCFDCKNSQRMTGGERLPNGAIAGIPYLLCGKDHGWLGWTLQIRVPENDRAAEAKAKDCKDFLL